MLTGFQLQAAPPASPAAGGNDSSVPLIAMNRLAKGDRLSYAPQGLPDAWRKSARVAVVLVPSSANASTDLPVFTNPADKPVTWTLPTDVGAVAFLFGPKGLNATKTRSLLGAHPELISQFIAYATRASRVEALVALLEKYEQSPPGSLDLKAMLKDYAAEYGVKPPPINAGTSPEQQAAQMLAAVAPPTAQNGPSPNAELTSGSTSTASALAAIYFGPEVMIANDTVPLFRALHKSLFPGTEFQGAFAQPAAAGMALCASNVAPPAGKRPVYIWVADLPGGARPSLRLSQTAAVTIPDRGSPKINVTAASVAQLRSLFRVRDWRLLSPPHSIAVPVTVSVNAADDTLTLDLRQAKVPPGHYQLAANWDWEPIAVDGTIKVRRLPDLSAAVLTPESQAGLAAGGGKVKIELKGADFSLVQQVSLLASGGKPETLPFSATSAQLTVSLDLDHLAAGSYKLRLSEPGASESTAGAGSGNGTDLVPLTIRPPDPTLSLPLEANLDEPAQAITLHGTHLERLEGLHSPGAGWQLYPVEAAGPYGPQGLTERGATVTLEPGASAGQKLPLELSIAGLTSPRTLEDAVHVLGPRPRILDVSEAAAAGGTIELLPGELAQNTITNVAFTLAHASGDPSIRLQCQQSDLGASALTLHPGDVKQAQELDASGGGLYYLAATPGEIGPAGCRLQMIASDADGASAPYDLGRIVRLPKIESFTLSNQSAGPGLFLGQLTGDNLQLIAQTGWTPDRGVPVTSIPQRGSAATPRQSLAIAMPWPPPAPHAPLYIWLRGEKQGRKTTITP